MIKYFLIAGLFMSGAAIAAPTTYDIRSKPGGVAGFAPTHVDGNDGGRPIIHRPEARPGHSVSNGVGRLNSGTGETERSVTYAGPGRGTFGSARSPIIVTNEDGRPELVYPN